MIISHQFFLLINHYAAGCVKRRLLMWTKEKMGCLPHIPSRICEAVLGRLS